jgi:hypothetical protein
VRMETPSGVRFDDVLVQQLQRRNRCNAALLVYTRLCVCPSFSVACTCVGVLCSGAKPVIFFVRERGWEKVTPKRGPVNSHPKIHMLGRKSATIRLCARENRVCC